jgi:DNA-binding NtrC family response regulator
VRELQNVLYRFVTLKRLDLGGSASMPVMGDAVVDTGPELAAAPLPDAVAVFESKMILTCLEQHRWNRTNSAKALGIGLRTLQRKMKAYGIQ